MFTCEICGKKYETPRYFDEYKNVCGADCFTKKYWQEIINEKEYHPIINGVCYYLNIDKPIEETTYGFLGFDGRRFKIKFNDGRIIETNNLWHNGDVPEWCRKDLPDNAEFVYS